MINKDMKNDPLYNLKSPVMLAHIVELVESVENQDRLKKHIIDYQIVNGNQKKLIVDDLMRRYPESWDTMVVICLGIARKIIRKLSRAYSSGVKREVVDKKTGVVNKKITDLINYIYNDTEDNDVSFDDTMISLNQDYETHKYAELYTYLEDFRIRFKSIPQALFTPLPNANKTKAEVIVFKRDVAELYQYWKFIDWDNSISELENVEVEGIYTVWSKEFNFTFAKVNGIDKTIKDYSDTDNRKTFKYIISPNDNNSEKINPYEIMPFVQAKEKTKGVFCPWGTEIAEMSKEMNIIFSDIVSIAAQQGFGQAVQYYSGENPPAITKTGPTHIINIPNEEGNSKFEFANANPDLRGHLDIALALIRLLLTTNDLTTDNVSGEVSASNFSSAIDRLIADSELITNIDDQRKKFYTIEKRQLAVNFAFLKYLLSIKKVPEDYPSFNIGDLDVAKYSLRLSFNTIKPQITEKDKASSIKKLEDDGFILPWEKHIRFSDGNMTEQEAKEREEEIRAFKKEAQKEMLKFGISKQQDMLKDMKGVDNDRPNEELQPSGFDKERQGITREARPFERSRQEEARGLDSRENKRENKKRYRSDPRRARV